MKVKTSELTGPALDWAVAKVEQKPLVFRGRKWPTDGAATVEYAPWAVHPVVDGSGPYVPVLCHFPYSPSTNWAHGGPIIEREKLDVVYQAGGRGDEWTCFANDIDDKLNSIEAGGPTPLIAAMRCFVASRLGDEVDIPEGLV